MLLSAFGVDPTTVSSIGAMLAGTSTITTQIAPPMDTSTPVSQTPPITNAPAPTTTGSAPATQSQARIVVFSPIGGKGYDRGNVSTSADFDERGQPRNEIYIAAIVYGTDGQPSSDATVKIDATGPTDTSPENESHMRYGTGNVGPIYVDGQKQIVPYYPLDWTVLTAGTHTVKFSALGLEQQITFEVSN